MIKIMTIIGARPQIIKAAALSRAIRTGFHDRITEIIVHTGQHYDKNMSAIFFSELQIPKPDYNLDCRSGTHAGMTAAMMERIEEVVIKEQPDAMVVYGDTNSTLAGSIVAAKLAVPLIHIEAGLRSFNKTMPEEINRIVCDSVSTLLFSPTKAGVANLEREGYRMDATPPYTINNPKIYYCGDIMYDNTLFFSEVAEQKKRFLVENGLTENNYILCTIHRDFNTDNPERITSIFNALIKISESDRIILPLHPRTLKVLETSLPSEIQRNIKNNKNLIITDPLSFLEMTCLEHYAKLIITDSGGVQKEAYFFKKPCIILRPETEWVEIVQQGAAKLVSADFEKILSAYTFYSDQKQIEYPALFGDGKAAHFIGKQILELCDSRI